MRGLERRSASCPLKSRHARIRARTNFKFASERSVLRDRDKKKGEEEEESAPPQKVVGIGDEAYWIGNRVGGAFYVLKGNAYVRISVGGPADQANKIKKSKVLAQKALARL